MQDSKHIHLMAQLMTNADYELYMEIPLCAALMCCKTVVKSKLLHMQSSQTTQLRLTPFKLH